MVKVICGPKGIGKTRALVESANNLVSSNTGDVVFIDGSSQLIYDLNHKIRFINLSEFPVKMNKVCTFLGFICGIISEDYDINGIFVDDVAGLLDKEIESLRELFDGMEDLSSKFNIEFYVTIEGERDKMPEFIKEHL